MANDRFHLEVHVPDRLRRYRALDVGCSRQYFDAARNEDTARRMAAEWFVPTGERLLRMIDGEEDFAVSISICGSTLDQLEQSAPEAPAVFARLAATGRVEFAGETYFHSLSFLYDRAELERQVAQHRDRIVARFGVCPTSFVASETANELAAWLDNPMQRAAVEALYGLRDAVYGAGDPALVRDWQRLTASDHLRAMSTRGSDGAALEPWSNGESPYEAYIGFMNVINDLALRLGEPAAQAIAEEPHLPPRSVVPAAAHLH